MAEVQMLMSFGANYFNVTKAISWINEWLGVE